MELLERENFLALLDEYARDAAGGDSRVVLIAGEAGVGKTALVEELQHRRPGRPLALGSLRRLLHAAAARAAARRGRPARWRAGRAVSVG